MDLAGHDGRHEEREGGGREEQVDLAAPDAERSGDRAHDDEEPEQAPRFLAGHQGDDNADRGADGDQEQGRPRRQPAKPACGTAGQVPVQAGLVASGPAAVDRTSVAGHTRPPGEIVWPGAAPVVTIRIRRRASLTAARCARAARSAVARPRRATRRETRAGLQAAPPCRGTAAPGLRPGIGVVTRQAPGPAWRTPSGIASCGAGPGLPPRWCAHCWRG